MGKLFDLLAKRNVMRHIAPLIREISNLCHGEVWNRVRELIFDMDLTEARGYVRARAAEVVRRQAQLELLDHPQIDAATQQQVITLATQRVVHLVVTDFVSGSPAARRPAA